MKFGHELERLLREDGYPEHWVKSAITYHQLKKCIKSILRELDELGIPPETMRQLLEAKAIPDDGQEVPLAQYTLAGDEPKTVRPRLTVLVDVEDGIAVNATLSPKTLAFLRSLSDKPARESAGPNGVDGAADSNEEVVRQPKRIEVPLTSVAEFFEKLQGGVADQDALMAREQAEMTQEIIQLGQMLTGVVKPSRWPWRKTDLFRWRQVFELYIGARAFFSTSEMDHGARNGPTARKQLAWFEDQVEQRKLVKAFQMEESRLAYKRFVDLNTRLRQNLEFNEAQSKAVYKILKKFDKRTGLSATPIFRDALAPQKFIVQNIAKDVCAEMSNQVVSIVPQLEDYSCPVCSNLAYLPLRLKCTHIFCVRCVVKLQRKHSRFCPLCRGDVVMKACPADVDYDLTRFMEKQFPQDVKEKKRIQDKEDADERLAVLATNFPGRNPR